MICRYTVLWLHTDKLVAEEQIKVKDCFFLVLPLIVKNNVYSEDHFVACFRNIWKKMTHIIEAYSRISHFKMMLILTVLDYVDIQYY